MKRLKEISEKPLTTHSAAREDIYDLRVELNRVIRALNQLALEADKVEEMVVFKAIEEREILNFSNIRR